MVYDTLTTFVKPTHNRLIVDYKRVGEFRRWNLKANTFSLIIFNQNKFIRMDMNGYTIHCQHSASPLKNIFEALLALSKEYYSQISGKR